MKRTSTANQLTSPASQKKSGGKQSFFPFTRPWYPPPWFKQLSSQHFFSFFPLRYEVQVNKWIKCLLRSHLSFCWEDSMMWVCKKQYCHWKHWWNLQNYKIILRKMLYHVPHVIIFISLMSPMSLFIKIHSINDRISTTVADSSQIENILYDPGYLNGF